MCSPFLRRVRPSFGVFALPSACSSFPQARSAFALLVGRPFKAGSSLVANAPKGHTAVARAWYNDEHGGIRWNMAGTTPGGRARQAGGRGKREGAASGAPTARRIGVRLIVPSLQIVPFFAPPFPVWPSARKADPIADNPIIDDPITFEVTFEAASGNVLASFGIPDADAHLVRADRAFQVRSALREREWTRVEAADQARTSQALQGQDGTDDI